MIRYYTERQFGHERKFIVDKELAEAFKKLTKRETLKDSDIESLTKLGVNFKEVKK